jgi:hypothetical protein
MTSPAEFLKNQLAAAQKKFGMNCYRADEHYVQQFGVPLPSLALQYMFGVENLPFGRFYGFRGKTESFKSTLVFYLLKVIMDYSGLGVLVETERKLSDTLQEGILQDKKPDLQILNADSLEMAQQLITFTLDFIKKNMHDRDIPYGIGWDSLRGVLSEATSSKISQDGHYSKSFSAEAHALSPYFAKLVEELSFWPVMLFFVQHEKKKQEEGYGAGGGAGSSALGGDAPGFHATVLTRSRVLKPVVEGALNPYSRIEYRTLKNNLGVKGRRCEVNLYFRQEEDEALGRNVHRYQFDWDRADIDCILSDKMENKSAVKDVVDIEEHSSNKGYFRSTALGLKKAEAFEVMEALRSDQALFDSLRRKMRITKNLRFDQVEWTQVGGTPKSPLMGWAVKEGVDLYGISGGPLVKEEEADGKEEVTE